MSVVIYNDYLIVAVAKQEEFAGAWSVSVDISARDAGRPISSFETRHEFETQAQAEDCGLNLARAWIHQRAGRCRAEEGTPATQRPQPVVAVSSVRRIHGELRNDVREFAEKMQEILGKDETKRNRSWTKSGLEELVHDVLDNTSALLMTNYNDESQRAALQATCLELATLAFIIRRNSQKTSMAQAKRLAEQSELGHNGPFRTTDDAKPGAAEKHLKKSAAVRQLKRKDPSSFG